MREPPQPAPAKAAQATHIASQRDAAEQAAERLAARAAGPLPPAPPPPGDALPAPTRAYFEHRLGADLSTVRIRADAAAAQEARRQRADAFAADGSIAFAAGRYAPGTPRGDRLLAHELAHVALGHRGIMRQDAPAGAPGSVSVTLDPEVPWMAKAEAGASPSAVSMEIYGNDLGPMIASGDQVPASGFRVVPDLLVEAYRTDFEAKMEARLARDAGRIEAILGFTYIDAAEESEMIGIVSSWAPARDLNRSAGDTWFDALMARLDTGDRPTALDRMYNEVEERAGELNTLVATNSATHGAFRTASSIIEDAVAGRPEPPPNPVLVDRAANLVLDQMAGATGEGGSRIMVDTLSGLPAREQAAVLKQIMDRHGETDFTGVTGRFGERSGTGMLYNLFEDLTEADRTRLATALKDSGVLPGDAVDALAAGRGIAGKYLPYTTALATEATEFYVREYEQREGLAAVPYAVGGGLSVLMTPGIAEQTILTLGTAGIGSGLGPVIAQSFPRLATGLAIGGTAIAGFNAGYALAELATGKDANGRSLDTGEKVAKGILVVSNLLMAAASILGLMQARAPGPVETPPAALPPGPVRPALPPADAAPQPGISIRIVKMDPVSGEALAVAQNQATGEVAMARLNLKTGAGEIYSPTRGVIPIEGGKLGVPRPALPGGTPPAAPVPAPAAPAGPPALPAAPAPRGMLPASASYRTMAEVLPDPNAPFRVPQIEQAYQAYRLCTVKPADRGDWIRLARGGNRGVLVNTLGPNFPGSGSGISAPGEVIRLGAIPKPQSLTDERLASLSGKVLGAGAQLSARFDPKAAKGAQPDEVSLGHFLILKGNVGEILAGDIQAEVTAGLQQRFPGSALYQGVQIQVPEGPAGALSPKRLYSDGIVAELRGGNLVVRGKFEVKAGAGGGQEATEQAFKRIELDLEDGAMLHVPGAGAFRYDPEASGPGRVIFLARAERHLLLTPESMHLGLGSDMQIAAPTLRHALPATSEEINYLTALAARQLIGK